LDVTRGGLSVQVSTTANCHRRWQLVGMILLKRKK